MARLAAVTAAPDELALLLDLDGTLAPIVARPEDVAVLPAAARLLPTVRDHVGLLGFISGRAGSDLRRIVNLEGVAYSGNHGLELVLPDGAVVPAGDPGSAGAVRRFAAAWGERPELRVLGIWLEDKGATLTFHFRTADDPAAAAAFLDREVRPAAEAVGLIAASGRMSLEIHPTAETTKGTAVSSLLDRAPEIRRAVSIGDDTSDVSVWDELRARVATGRLADALAIGVASRESPPEVLTGADGLVDGPAGVVEAIEVIAAHPAR